MPLSDDLFTVFSAEIEFRDGVPVVEVPDRELSVGNLEAGGTYRVAILEQTSPSAVDEGSTESTSRRPESETESQPPVEKGETLEVEIEDVGDQGDGIARIGPGYIVFVPDTEIGDRVRIEITQARDNFAFAEVLEHEPVSGR
ncbi:MAG: TRAM domain-containing protein [Haloferacaceae archaeon]